MFCKTTWNRPLHAQSPGTTTRFSNCCVDMLEVLKPIHRSYSSAIGVVAFKTKCTQRQTRPARNLVLADVVIVETAVHETSTTLWCTYVLFYMEDKIN